MLVLWKEIQCTCKTVSQLLSHGLVNTVLSPNLMSKMRITLSSRKIVYVCICVHMFVRACVCGCACVGVCMSVWMCVCICMYVQCVHVGECACVFYSTIYLHFLFLILFYNHYEHLTLDFILEVRKF